MEEQSLRKLEDPAEFTDPGLLHEELITVIERYHPSDDALLIHRAYTIAKSAYMDQKWEPDGSYTIHPLCVATILADLKLDKETIVADPLHDVVKDTILTGEQTSRVFGEDVAVLVNGVTKLTQVIWTTDKLNIQAKDLRKVSLATSQDIRVILIKLADRLHNMRTLQHMRPGKQREKAKETLEIYAPLADRLGINCLKVKFDDFALRYLKPRVYRDLEEKIEEKSHGTGHLFGTIIAEVQGTINSSKILSSVIGRRKHIFSIYREMVNQHKTSDEICDFFAVHMFVQDLNDCCVVLGWLHVYSTPLPERFKGYVAHPKPNRYQSLHTVVLLRNRTPFEVQIRTYEMDKVAEYGIAAYRKYKEKAEGKNPALTGGEAEEIRWLHQILKRQREIPDDREFLSDAKNELNPSTNMVYAFTSGGDVKTPPTGLTPIDFAYSIHSAAGNRIVGARVNGHMVPFDYRIQNGSRIEILTSQNSRGPSRG